MIGIYKITSPTGKIYVGQSINIEKRFYQYKKLHCKGQVILYNSFIKHGVEKHKFEILCECEISELNDKERYYQDLYSVLEEKGMNCNLTKSSDRSGKHSDETKLKISIANKGRKHSEETKDKIRKRNLGNNYRTGIPTKEETKIKIGLGNLGKIRTKDFKINASIKTKGRITNEETKNKLSIQKLGKLNPMYGNTKENHHNYGKNWKQKNEFKKLILDTSTGIFFYGFQEAADAFLIKRSTLQGYLSGFRKNKTNLIYV